MTVIYPDESNRNISDIKPEKSGYDLQSEKQRIDEGTEEIKKELIEMWKQRYAGAEIFPNALVRIDKELVNFLLNYDNTLFYNDLSRKFNLNQDQRDAIPQLVWKICLNRQWPDAESFFSGSLGVNSETASRIASLVEEKIFSKAKSLGNTSAGNMSGGPIDRKEENYAKISISQAMGDFPKINEQKITSGAIKVAGASYPLQPTVKNWIGDFYRELGAGSHNIIERGNYLYHSANTKSLSSADRQKLAIILKSLSEGVPLFIDRLNQKIVFPEMNKPVNQKTAPSFIPEVAPAGQGAAVSEKNSVSQKRNFDSMVFDRPLETRSSLDQNVPPRPASSADFRGQNRFKIQDVAPKSEAPVSGYGEQLRKSHFENVAQEKKAAVISEKEEDDLGKIEFSTTQVMPADKPQPVSPPTSRPARISPIGRNGNVI